jgi:hypothetical protein
MVRHLTRTAHLSISEVQAIVRTITYKPFWHFDVQRLAWSEDYEFRIWYAAPDATGQKTEPVKITTSWLARPVDLRKKSNVVAVVVFLIKKAEEHERNEWLRIAGEHYSHPHPELLRL